jgi:serine/threonine protein kinase
MKYLSNLKIYHRDLKAENILINNLTKEVKITDFGQSTQKRKNSKLFETLKIQGFFFNNFYFLEHRKIN